MRIKIYFTTSIICLFLLTGCKKPYVDINCDDVTLCVKNTSSDTININWHSTGYETDWPIMILPGQEVCQGFGSYEEYGKDGLFNDEYSQSGQNTVYYSTDNGEYYYHPFSSCEDHVEISK